MTNLATNLGSAIKLCRNKRGLSQGDLARKTDLSVSYLSLIEKGKRTPNLEVLDKIAKALNLPLNLLVFLATDKSELASIDKSIAEKLSLLVLELIESEPAEASVSA